MDKERKDKGGERNGTKDKEGKEKGKKDKNKKEEEEGNCGNKK